MPGTAATWVDGDIATAAKLNALPRGIMGYALGATANQAGISTATDITGLSVTFTAISSRIYRTRLVVIFSQQTSDAQQTITITDGAGTQKNAASVNLETNDIIAIAFDHIETGISGAITRKARAQTNAGTMTIVGSATQFGSIVVEDMGV